MNKLRVDVWFFLAHDFRKYTRAIFLSLVSRTLVIIALARLITNINFVEVVEHISDASVYFMAGIYVLFDLTVCTLEILRAHYTLRRRDNY